MNKYKQKKKVKKVDSLEVLVVCFLGKIKLQYKRKLKRRKLKILMISLVNLKKVKTFKKV